MGLQKLLLLLLLLLVLLLLLLCLVAAAIAAGVAAAVVAAVLFIPTQMTHALDVYKRQQSLKDSSRAALEFPSLRCFLVRQVFCSSRYRLSIHGLCLSVILYSCMEQLITEAAALNLPQLTAIK